MKERILGIPGNHENELSRIRLIIYTTIHNKF